MTETDQPRVRAPRVEVRRVEVRRVDPADIDGLRAWWDVGRQVEAVRPIDDHWPFEACRILLNDPRADADRRPFAVLDDGQIVAAGRVDLPLEENTHAAYAQVQVLEEHRRRGHGSRLLATLEGEARAAGRRSLLGDVLAPMRGDPAGAGFAAAQGFTLASAEEVKALDLASSEGGWAGHAAALAGHHPGHRLVAWRGSTPSELVEGTCALYARFMDEIPLGELDLAGSDWDEARLREDEERDARAGQHRFVVVAVAADGRVVGFTDLYVTDGQTHLAWIGGTLVLPEERGTASAPR
ncbi:GNAT family N-acetyltransferase [Nocardioides donggukensis]|uniref:GNAT family N-acetyltransferase n=1 Tax=Nocardioides donggukensis TaxID=2774019 RepID=A0A927K240_9ACTN|nr:GNAT family N-acetyltransferase [Nocardioides donggukensis]MBD8868534.1 GNAT family N-acetyltransferase [Nocardioides donggukensis]